MALPSTGLFERFLNSEQASGIVLILATLTALVLANSAWGPAIQAMWQTKIGLAAAGIDLRLTLAHWINDGLMSIFFLLIGLEIERELYIGKLAKPREALLPAVAALGGMLVPALLHYLANRGLPTQSGIGIPMATDIAFALGVLALLGKRIPPALKVFVAAFAIIDDLGAIALIALFYAQDFSLPMFAVALHIFLGLLALNRLGVNRLIWYLVPGVLLWYCLLRSGVHATLAGVLLAFAIPFRQGDTASPSAMLQHWLHKPVAFLIMPLFALANTGILLDSNALAGLATANSVGIMGGLVVGKPLGIVLACGLAVGLGVASLPDTVTWRHILGAGLLGGIGFTMSIFIALLAFDAPGTIQNAKIAVLLSSLCAGVAGFCLLRPPPDNAG